LEWVILSNKLMIALIPSCVDLCFINPKELPSDFASTTRSIPNWYTPWPALSITVDIYNALIYPLFPLDIYTLIKRFARYSEGLRLFPSLLELIFSNLYYLLLFFHLHMHFYLLYCLHLFFLPVSAFQGSVLILIVIYKSL